MTTLTEGQHAAEFLVSQAHGARSREAITVASGQNLVAGSVLGKKSVGAGTGAADAGNTGDGTIGAITIAVGAKAGTYRVTVIEPAVDLGAFQVEDPDGINVGTGVVGTAFSGGGVGFTIADGATDFVAGDAFDVTVAVGTGEFAIHDPTATDGTETAVGVIFAAVDATAAAKAGVMLARDAEVTSAELIFFAGATQPQKDAALAQLKAVGILGR